ncbi:MAG: phosphopantothenoylcysteine decarboxylase [Patescibacteria group bacterium]|jgi:phosphopantothenate-cysteine ligase/phosphopantothenoylcysteine decarboxylase/phosphopantothenate--cysteine ligase
MERKRILVTAGSTVVPIDQVRVISNIFKGKTGTAIAAHFAERGHGVTLLTSNPELLEDYREISNGWNIQVVKFRTFNDLASAMKKLITAGAYDMIVHSAAVSDYQVAQVLTKDVGGQLLPLDAGTKVSSRHGKLYLEMVPTAKLIDKIRTDWGFAGYLVKFKLQVGIGDGELVNIARQSRADSASDLIIANCLEWAAQYAYAIGSDNTAEKISREKIGETIERRAGWYDEK